MPTNHHRNSRRQFHRSEAQQLGSAAMAYVMQAWEALTDDQRLTWDVAGRRRRMKGINYFKQVNLRRARRGDDILPAPPAFKADDTRPLLKGLAIRNRAGRITLKLELRRAPDSPRTVWASLPCNLGLKTPRRCPSLGWLPEAQAGWCDITGLYFGKHAEYLYRHGVQLTGKRIFVRLRPETDDGPNLFEQVKAVVPAPEPQTRKNPFSPSKDHRRSIEGPSNVHRSIRLAPGQQ